MNGYPFAGPGGQKTVHRQAAETKPVLSLSGSFTVAGANHWAMSGYWTPQQAYAAVMQFDNR